MKVTLLLRSITMVNAAAGLHAFDHGNSVHRRLSHSNAGLTGK